MSSNYQIDRRRFPGRSGKLIRARQRCLGVLFRLITMPSRPKMVLIIADPNFAGVDWRTVFASSVWSRLLYRVRSLSFHRFLEIGDRILAPEDRPVVSGDAYRETAFHGYRLWELAKCGVLASLERTSIPDPVSERELAVIRFYYDRVCSLIAGAESVFDRTRTDTVIIPQGSTPMSRPIVEAARDRDVNIVATERSFLGDYFFCDNATGMIINRHRASRLDGDWIPSRVFTGEQRDLFRSRLRDAQKSKGEDHYTGNPVGQPGEAIRKRLGIPDKRKIAVFIGQVMTDASIIMDSPAFPDPVSLILRVSEFFRARPGWTLVIRLHPKEHTGVSWANSKHLFGPPPGEKTGPLPYKDLTYRSCLAADPDLEKKCLIIRDTEINTAALTREADLGITINSQAGFEMALQYRRVVVCGDAFFARKGFTCEVAHERALESVLEYACRNTELSETEKYLADQFGEHLLNSVLHRRDLKCPSPRLFRVIDGAPFWGLRKIIIRRAVKTGITDALPEVK